MRQALKAVGLIVLLLQGVASAQTVSVPVPVDISKVTATVPVTAKFKDANGVWWEASGTLTVKPIPPPAPGPVTDGSVTPSVFDATFTGTRLVLLGSGFGVEPGRLLLDFVDAPWLEWGDRMITADTAREPAAYTVVRPDGQWYTAALAAKVPLEERMANP